jgi:Mrp family chromosome partitioning ATPase
MAKLDQSFIKAYGHVGGRTSAGRAESTSSAPLATAAPPVISTAPVVIDAGSFSVDTTCQASSNIACASSTPAVEPVRTHEEHPVAPPKKPRKPAAKREAAASKPQAAAPLVTTFQADSLSVDTFPAQQPAETPKPATKQPAPQPPRAAKPASEPLCHRACTIQFSTTTDSLTREPVSDAADECDEELLIEDDQDETEYEREVTQHVHQPANHRPHVAPAAAPAPRIDGAAYHRVTAPAKPTLRAGYEVDAFRWPEVVNGLSGRATTALSTLIDELVDASSAGRGVIMFAGERRGAGATTLAIYAARRMAELGLSVALVDADFAKPTLARSLGVAVEHGWDDAIQAQTDFAAAMIASLEDGVSILPCRQASTNNTGARAARLAEDLAVLRKHFALVLLDGGPLAEVAEPWLNHAPEDTIDCGIVVRDVRLDAARRGPNRPHTPHAAYPAIGIVENFVSENTTK